MTERGKELAENLNNVSTDIKTVVPIATEIIQSLSKAVKFVVRCFGCKNEPKSQPVLLHRESLEIKQVRNSVQVAGVCATCGKKVRGFIPVAQAKELDPNFTMKPVRGKKRKVVDDPDAVGAKRPALAEVVGEPLPTEENKQ